MGTVEFNVSETGRIQPPDELDRIDDKYPNLRVYQYGDKELFSVTSIYGAVHEKPERLVNWLKNNPDAERWRNFTAIRGTRIHREILKDYASRYLEQEIWEEEHLDPEQVTKLREDIERAKTMWSKVWQKHDFGDVKGVEVKVWNEELGYAGTFDLLMYLDGKLTLVDLKTSKEAYEKFPYQLTAYKMAAEPMYDIDIEQMAVIRLCPDQRHNPWLNPAVHWFEPKEQEWRDICHEFHDEVLPQVKAEFDE